MKLIGGHDSADVVASGHVDELRPYLKSILIEIQWATTVTAERSVVPRHAHATCSLSQKDFWIVYLRTRLITFSFVFSYVS